MMKKIFVLSFIFIATKVIAQKEKVQLYIDIYKEIAMQEMQRSGVPAAITLAQGILESKFGESELSQKSNNHFGIKCKLDWNGEKVYSDDDTKQECFRKYNTPQESYKDHSDFLKSRSHYAWLFTLDPADYVAWAKGLKKSGYATESDYPERLIGLIEDYQLNQYSLLVLNKSQNNNTANATVAKTNKTTVKTTIVEDEKDEAEVAAAKPINASSAVAAVNNYPTTVFAINGCKVIYAKAGTSMLSIANNYNIELAKIFELNDMKETEILDADKLIFLEKKQKRGIAEFHIVTANETMYDICQKEGIRLDVLLEYNNLTNKQNPLVGEKIYLRSKAPKAPKLATALVQTITTKTNNTL